MQQNATLIDLSAIISGDDDQLVKGAPESAGHYDRMFNQNNNHKRGKWQNTRIGPKAPKFIYFARREDTDQYPNTFDSIT